MARPAVLVALAALVAALAGCGDSDKTTTPTGPALETTTVNGAADGSETALLEKIDVSHQEGYDQIVFQFRNSLPGYRVEYVKPPLTEDGSGRTVTVAGKAYLSIRMEPASGFDLNTAEGRLVYTGPRRISTSDTDVVQQLFRTRDFEAVLAGVAGMSERAPCRVQKQLESPPRLLVEVQTPRRR